MAMTLAFEDKIIQLFPGETVADALKRSDIPIAFCCGGRNRCGSCRIKLISGTFLSSGTLLEVSPGTPVEANSCTLHMISARGEASFPDREENSLPAALPCPPLPAFKNPRQGTFIAIDLGSTNTAAALIQNGRIISCCETPNRQSAMGSNIIDRIAFAAAPGGFQRLREALIAETLSPLIAQLLPPGTTVDAVAAAGNTAMSCFFFGTDPSPLGHAPFELGEVSFVHTAGGIGLTLLPPDTPVTGVPHLCSFIGGDVLAGLFLSNFGSSDRCELYLDIGTNCEMILNDRGRYYALSAAAGPAFERNGCCGKNHLRHLHYRKDRWVFDPPLAAPEGLSGTALADFLSEAHKAGFLDDFGKRIRKTDLSGKYFPSDAEIAELITAKAAVSSGLQLLLKTAGIREKEIERVYLAGSFAYHLDIGNARYTGLLPDLPEECFIKTGNASLAGAAAWLLSGEPAAETEKLRSGIIHINPANDPGCMTLFASAMSIKGGEKK